MTSSIPNTDDQPQTLTADLYALDYIINQISVKFSVVVIEAKKNKYKELNTEYSVMDVHDLQLPTASILG